jgi:hypothetical protein
MGEHVAKQVLELESENAAGYVLLWNISAAAMGICVKMLNSRGQRCEETLGCSWIEVNNEVHTFVVDDQDHP